MLDALDRSITLAIEVLTPLILMLLSIPHALGFLTSLSTDIGAPDIKHQCPNDNSSSSCYSLGLRSGLVAGKEMRESDFTYSFGVSFGCWYQHSPNFCLGYLLSFDKAFLGRPANVSQIWQVANKTGWDDGAQNTTVSPNPPCSMNALFCIPFTKAYQQSYRYNIPYWVGYANGMRFAKHLISICHEENYSEIPGYHTTIYKKGWIEGYEGATRVASNGNGCHKYY